MKKDGPVKPANQQKHDRCLPPRLTIQSRLWRPLRERCGLCKITHCVRLWRMRLAYANASSSAIGPGGSRDVTVPGETRARLELLAPVPSRSRRSIGYYERRRRPGGLRKSVPPRLVGGRGGSRRIRFSTVAIDASARTRDGAARTSSRK